MLTIRLQRAGTKNKPEYRIVLAEKTVAVNKKFIEVLGSYNPRHKSFSIRNQERLQYWIAQNVEMSPTVHNLMVAKNLLDKPKIKSFSVPKKAVEETAEKLVSASTGQTEKPAETPPNPADTEKEQASSETPIAQS